jgi:hypothetical protein
MTGLLTLADLRVILIAGLICGILDITCAGTLNRLRGIEPMRTLQGVASGALGPKSFSGGRCTAALGLGFHFFIAFAITAAYYSASRKLGFLNGHAVLSGLLYGIAVHLFMSFVVVPLSSVKRPFSMTFFAIQFVVHMFCVGLPISLVVRHFA